MKEKLTPQDYVLFTIVFLCSYFDSGVWSTVSAILPPLKSAGSPSLCFVLSFYLFIDSVLKGYQARCRLLYYLVWIATLWTIIKLIQTSIDTSFIEAVTIYRRNYILLPSFLMCMSYISSMSVDRIETFGKLILKWITPLAILYFLQCSGVKLFSNNVSYQTVGEVKVLRNILGMPPVLPVIFALCFISYLWYRSKQLLCYVLICLGVTFISFTRSLMASAAMIVLLTMFFQTLRYGGVQRRLVKIVTYIILAAFLLIIVYPSSFAFWSNLIDDTINSQLVKSQGTYAFRQRLIEHVIDVNEQKGTLMTGLGYLRDAAKGKYSFVLGGDTYVAPILWCEGFMGLILRCMPICYLLLQGLRMYRFPYNRREEIISLVIIVSIISEIPNYVQTVIFVRYNFIVAMLYMLYVYTLKVREASEEEET